MGDYWFGWVIGFGLGFYWGIIFSRYMNLRSKRKQQEINARIDALHD